MLSQNPEPENAQTEVNDLKKKRDEYNVEIRKKKRDDLLSKKRNNTLEINQRLQGGQAATENQNLSTNQELKHLIDGWLNREYTMAEFPQIVEATSSDDVVKKHYGAIGLRKLLSNENGTHIQAVIDANLVPRLIQFMQDESEPHLQMEAAWALTNIASGTSSQTQCIIDKGGILCFINLLRSNRTIIAEQAIWALGNIAGDSPVFRDMILNCGGLQPLLDIVNKTSNDIIIKHGTWTLSNLCRGKPPPKIERVKAALPTMAAVIQQQTDVEVITDAMWALSYLTREGSQIQPAIETGMVPAVIRLLDNPHLPLTIPCLRVIGNISTGSPAQTDTILCHSDFLPKAFKFLTHKKRTVRRETCWIFSNITAGESRQIEMIVGVPEYLNTIMEKAMKDQGEVQREAAWVLSNATKHSSPQLIEYLIESQVLDCFLALLSSEDHETVQIVLEAINNILDWGAKTATQTNAYENAFLKVLEDKGGVKKIEDLQHHPNTSVYMKALKILENHFELENAI